MTAAAATRSLWNPEGKETEKINCDKRDMNAAVEKTLEEMKSSIPLEAFACDASPRR